MADASDLRAALGEKAEIHGEAHAHFSNAKPVHEADEKSVSWINPRRADKQSLLDTTHARVVIVAPGLAFDGALAAQKCVVVAANPKLAFIRVLRRCFAEDSREAPAIDPTAQISKDAVIAKGVRIGAFATIERAVIGEGCVIGARAFVGDGSRLGKNVVLAPSAIVGVSGFGYTANEDGEWEHFPHVGGVVLGDDVAVGAHACVVRGTLGDTIVGKGTKIDNLVSIGHNARVGERTLVAANSVVCGSAIIGNDVWISPLALVMNGIRVGDKSVIGAGVVCARDTEPGTTLVTTPPKVLPRSMRRGSPLA